MECRGCQVCDGRKRGLVCTGCVRKSVITENVLWALEAAKKQRDELASRVQQALLQQEETREQQSKRQALYESLEAARVRTARAVALRGKALEEAESLRRSHPSRRETAIRSTAQVKQAEEDESKAAVVETRQHLLQLHIFREQVHSELRKHVRLLLEIVPLSLSPLKPSSKQPAAELAAQPVVSIFGCPLPNTLAIPSGSNQQKLSTALGYAMLVLDVLSSLLGAPLLHHLHFKGSASELWMQRSFWDERPSEQGHTFRLYHASQQEKPSAVHTAPAPPMGALAGLRQRWPWEAFKSVPVVAPSIVVSTQRQREDLQAGMLQLFRSISALRNDQQLRFTTRIPREWSPFAALVGLCLQLAKDPASDGRRSMADSMAAMPKELVESVAFLDAFMLEGEQDDEEFEGWDLVQRPGGLMAPATRDRRDPVRMPPTPSDSDDAIRHWERAMITDSSGSRARQPGVSLGARIAPIGQGALAAADRIWQGLRGG